MKELQAFEIWVYRKMFKISWTQKIGHEVMEMVQTKEYVVPTIKKRKLVYFGHMLRRDNLRVASQGRQNFRNFSEI